MKKKKKGILEGKGKWIAISTAVFAILGITLLVIGFGVTYGWGAVLAWFGSRWAIYIYILLGLFAFLGAWIAFKVKIGE